MFLTALFGILVGLALGLTGGGGSIFAIPLLVFGLGIDPREAITISLAAVTIVAFTGALSAAKHRLVEYRAAGLFAIAGLFTAPAGILVANQLDDTILLLTFSGLMVVVAVSMWRKARSSPESARVVRARFTEDGDGSGPPCRFDPEKTTLKLTSPCSAVLTGMGLLTGFLSGLFGVGGGFIIVPALMIVTQLNIQRAVATSLMVISLVGATGLVSALISGRNVALEATLIFLTGGIAGMLGGRVIASWIAGPALQKAFAIMMFLVAIWTLWSKSLGL